MDAEEKRRIIAESREICARLAHLKSKNGSTPPRADEVNKNYAERRDAGREFAEWAGQQIRNDIKAIGKEMDSVLREKLLGIAEAIDQRDERILKLELELARAQVDIARIEAELVAIRIDRERQIENTFALLPTPDRKEMN
jgi:hypothetical protein